MKILIIGGGNMGLTYARSFLKSHVTDLSDLMILEKSEEKVKILESEQVGIIFSSPEECINKADLVVLAVKPQDCGRLFEDIKPHLGSQQLFLSIMAGVKIKSICNMLGVNKVIRAMPNLPAQIGMGMTAFTASDEVTRIELVTVQNLLNTTGKAIFVENEALIDAATAVSGSGPAYVYFYMNAMIDAAKALGFSESEAELLVGQTFMGSAHLLNRDQLSCKDWIAKVSSKGGTTEAAMNIYNENGLNDKIKEGLFKAHKRAIELGQE
ncbi:MAG: pyrroline-5-carboxylate reductase [Bacteroidota bacterium]